MTTYYNNGDALKGDIIECESRKMSKKRRLEKVAGTKPKVLY